MLNYNISRSRLKQSERVTLIQDTAGNSFFLYLNAMQQANCLNCGAVLTPKQKFCDNCGQKKDLPRITIPNLAKEFLQIITHADKGLLKLLKGLVTNPGKTAAEYVEGKRKTYFSPFTFLALCIAFMLFVNTWIKPYGDLPVPDPEVLARIPDEETRELYILTIERNAKMQNFSNKNLSIISVLVAPYFAFFLWLFFPNRNRNVAEITVAYILFTGIGNVLSTIFISPWLAMYRNTSAYYPIFCTSLFLQTMYYAWGLKTFFNYKTAGGYIKVLAALGLIGLIGFILLIIVLFFYVYHGAFSVFQYL